MERLLTKENVKSTTLTISLLSWLFLLFIGLYEQHYHSIGQKLTFSPIFLKGLFLNLYVISTYFHVLTRKSTEARIVFFSLLWKVFITALICTFFSSIITLFLYLTDHTTLSSNLILHTFFFHIEFGLLIIFLTTAFISWRDMILYKKNKLTHYVWRVFEMSISLMLLGHFFPVDKIDIFHNAIYLTMVTIIVLLSINVKWMPQLTHSQKISSLIYLIGILICLAYFLIQITDYFKNEPLVIDDLSKSLFLLTFCTFIVFYAFVCGLITVFNLRNTSLFEQKFKEISAFEHLGEAILQGKNKKDVFSLLLDNAMSLIGADAGWLEITDNEKYYITRNINEDKMKLIRQEATQKESKQYKLNPHYESVMVRPLYSGKHNIGKLVLIKNLNKSFDRFINGLVNSFVSQADITIHNFKSLSEAIKNERYERELEIAKNVHDSLFPENITQHKDLELCAYSEAAKEVGGDYYDFYQISQHRYAIIIADVSGNGISGAFNMAQMKGIFQALVRLSLEPDEFLNQANRALSNSLQKDIFITATYFQIDTQNQTVTLSRAGHCPTLYYDSSQKKAVFFRTKGLGLGIVRDNKYKDFTQIHSFKYQVGDMLLLYTDGLIEASKVNSPDHYGYEQLKDFFQKYNYLPLKDFSNKLLLDVRKFTERDYIEDDFTILLIRFI